VRKAIKTSEDAGDMDTSDLCINISSVVDKYLWFVEAHVQHETAAPGKQSSKTAG
jgi:starvation-inducible DNA-binding protein